MKTWSDEEVELLKRFYPSSTKDEIRALIPNKTHLAIYKKSKALQLKRTDETKYRNSVQGRSKAHFEHKPFEKCGYVRIYMPQHPRADRFGRIFEHIVVWERANGMLVPDGYVVHHKNGIKNDNRIENLELLEKGAHSAYHNSKRLFSNATKHKISQKSKERLAVKSNHPKYKEIDLAEFGRLIREGAKVKDICTKFNICKSTFYEKKKELERI